MQSAGAAATVSSAPVQSPSAAPAKIAVARPLLPAAAHIVPYLERIDGARWYSNFGPLITELEQRLSDRHGGAPVATVANATQGLTLALKAMAPRSGLCLIPGFTFVATAHAVVQAHDLDPGAAVFAHAGAHLTRLGVEAGLLPVPVARTCGAGYHRVHLGDHGVDCGPVGVHGPILCCCDGALARTGIPADFG